MSKKQPTYTQDFKTKICELRESGKTIAEIKNEYGLANATIVNWHKKYKKTGSFKKADNLSKEEIELRTLRKENKRLKMEVDILKQAALIMGRNGE